MIELDGIKNKLKLGVNVILGVFLVIVKVVVYELGMFLYCYVGGVSVKIFLVLMMNIINGGLYSDVFIVF